ncbi:MAG: hypothetical protein H0V73_13065 [Chloroflexi bacterium]|nr:hypothetical protein [Chloroflexota bacterium]
MIADNDLYRLAGWSGWLALIAFVVSGIALALFFGGAGQVFGPINDAFIAMALVALIPAVVAVDRLAVNELAPWVRVVTIAAIVGIVIASVGQVLLIVGRISLEQSYLTGSIGIAPVLAWIVLVAVLGLGPGLVPAMLGWLAIASLGAVAIAVIVAVVMTGPAVWIASVGLAIVLAAWIGGLALTLGSRAAATA